MNAITIDRCPNCPGTHRCVQADGPEDANILFIGERPGLDESKPFGGGQAGREFNENYLWLAGLKRENIRITNTVLCGTDGNRKPSEKELCCGKHHLPEELYHCDPDLVVLLGGTAAGLVPNLNLDIEHGIPRYAELFGWTGPVVPMYHPAAGLHDTSKMIPILEDFERLGKILRGEWFPPVDMHTPDYRCIHTQDDLIANLNTIPAGSKLFAIDTERHGNDPFSIQFSYRPGTGYMLLQSDRVLSKMRGEQELFRVLDGWLACFQAGRGEVVLHHAGQDLDWLEKMGVKVWAFRDTMQEAYHLGNLPQGLKALAYRLCGVRMTGYEDTVLPWSRQKLQEWLLEASDYAATHLTYRLTKQLKTKTKEIQKPGVVQRGLGRIWGHSHTPTYNPWKKLEELWQATAPMSELEREFVESTCVPFRIGMRADRVSQKQTSHPDMLEFPGPIPTEGIAHVPLDIAIQYGCMDADFTLRVALELETRRQEIMADGGEWCVMEGDEDA